MKLYHFTCSHGASGIEKTGWVLPNRHPMLGVAVAWFTDLDDPDPDSVGLTSTIINCDRLEVRFEVDPSVPHPWLGSIEQTLTPTTFQADLHRYSQPEHWWVSRKPVPVI